MADRWRNIATTLIDSDCECNRLIRTTDNDDRKILGLVRLQPCGDVGTQTPGSESMYVMETLRLVRSHFALLIMVAAFCSLLGFLAARSINQCKL